MACDIAYDLDGVLAEKPPESPKKWGHMNGEERRARKAFLVEHYRNAKPLLHPKEGFIVFTARKGEPDVVEATQAWFMQHYGFVPELFFLQESRNVENVVNFKSEQARTHGIKKYFEDNKKVLKGMQKAHPRCQYFYVSPTLEITPFMG